MKALIIDTSTKESLLALLQEDQIIFWEVSSHENQLSKSLFSSLQRVPLKELAYIAVGTGPGAFIGTRIGVAVAKGLSYGLEIPLLGFCSSLGHLADAQASLPGFLHEKFLSKSYHPLREIPLTYPDKLT
jgi:tRNA threonylcarbamoyl adenosine modification protein YeaZ